MKYLNESDELMKLLDKDKNEKGESKRWIGSFYVNKSVYYLYKLEKGVGVHITLGFTVKDESICWISILPDDYIGMVNRLSNEEYIKTFTNISKDTYRVIKLVLEHLYIWEIYINIRDDLTDLVTPIINKAGYNLFSTQRINCFRVLKKGSSLTDIYE